MREIEPVRATKQALVNTKMAQDVGKMFGVPAVQILDLLRQKLVKVPKGDPPATDAEMAIVLSVIRKYDLDPMLGQVHAWRDYKGDLAIMPGVDGWIKHAKTDPDFLGVTYAEGPMIPSPDGKGQECPEWIQATVIHARAGTLPQPKVWLREWYVPQHGKPAPWQKQTAHKLHVIAYRLAVREVVGMGGVVIDEDAAFHRPAQDLGFATDAATELMLHSGHEGADDGPCDERGQGDQPPADGAGPGAGPHAEALKPDSDCPCGIVRCGEPAAFQCADCGGWFCAGHFHHQNERCLICHEEG